jgi:hypothetical protein
MTYYENVNYCQTHKLFKKFTSMHLIQHYHLLYGFKIFLYNIKLNILILMIVTDIEL